MLVPGTKLRSSNLTHVQYNCKVLVYSTLQRLFSKYSFLAHQIKTRHVCDSCRTINLKFLKQKHLIKICQNLEWNSFIDTVAYATLTSARELKIICNGKKMNKENYEELIMVRMIRSRELTAGNRTKNTH